MASSRRHLTPNHLARSLYTIIVIYERYKRVHTNSYIIIHNTRNIKYLSCVVGVVVYAFLLFSFWRKTVSRAKDGRLLSRLCQMSFVCVCVFEVDELTSAGGLTIDPRVLYQNIILYVYVLYTRNSQI